MRTEWKINALITVMACIIGLGMTITAVQADDAAQGDPKAVFPETRYEFGSVMEGDKITHDFIIENHGQAPLIIQRVQPD